MHRTEWLTILAAVLLLSSNRSARVTRQESMNFKRNTTRLGAQFQRDCNEELLKVPPTLSPKCQDENKEVQDAWNRLQAERSKK